MLQAVETTLARSDDSVDEPAARIIFLDHVRRARLSARAPFRPIRVLIADGHALFRAGIRAVLEADQRIDAVGEAESGQAAVTLAARVRPDVVLLDADLPGLDVVEVTRQIVAQSDAEVMLLTSSDHDERNFAALRAGAAGLLRKDAEPGELASAVEVLARGEALLSPGVTRRLIAELASRSAQCLPKVRTPRAPDPRPLSLVT
jgi:DNA-binding NarL/FixJ family response regulator